MYTPTQFESHLRQLPTEEHILNNERRVNYFTGQSAYTHMQALNIPPPDLQHHFDNLIANEIIVRATFTKTGSNKSASSKSASNLRIALSKTFNKADAYIWVTDTPQYTALLLSGLLIVVVLLLVMYQVWPSQIRSKTTYVFYPIFAFFIFLGVLAVVRIVVFLGSYVMCQPGIWLFPNLFADVGFVDSFVPVWEYHGKECKRKKRED